MKDLSLFHNLFDPDHQDTTESVAPLDALKQLNEMVTEALLAHLREQPQTTKDLLKQALPQLLRAMSALGMDPVEETGDQPQQPGQRLVHIDGNRVQFRVDDELRGSWSIWSVADLKEVCRLAEEFDCGLVYSFMGSLSPSRVAEGRRFDQGEMLGDGEDPLAS